MQRDIRVTWFFPHPPEDVWECLTQPALMNQWFMQNDFLPVPGHQFQFRSKPLPKMGWDGIVYCQVLEVTPLKRLSFSWKGGPGNGRITLDSIVSWTLTPKEDGTELLLEHSGFRGFKNFISSIIMESGWKKGIQRRFGRVLNQYINDKQYH